MQGSNKIRYNSLLKFTTTSIRFNHTRCAIVGGGTGGMTVASQLIRFNVFKPNEITVFDPSSLHWYQPGFTMVSGGLLGDTDREIADIESKLLHRPIEYVFNDNIKLIKDSIEEFNPDHSNIITSHGTKYTYDYLIVSSGLKLRYDLTPGLQEALDDPLSSVGSMYNFNYAKKINRLRARFESGKVVCVQPPVPIKCIGATQKWVYLSEYSFRKKGIRNDVEIHFYLAGPALFGIPKYSKALTKVANSKDIKLHYLHNLIKVDDKNKKVYFKTSDGKEIVDNYDLLHVTPLQRPVESLSKSLLADSSGFLDIDKYTLQSKKFGNVWGIGDNTSAPNAKTAAAVFSQAPILVNNLSKHMYGRQSYQKYDGYGSCPVFVGDNKLMLLEFIYDGVIKETFPFDQSVPNHAFFYMKRYLFPRIYWDIAPHGHWFGNNTIFRPKFLV